MQNKIHSTKQFVKHYMQDQLQDQLQDLGISQFGPL